MVEIIISRDRCKNPLECTRCMKICPAGVFYAYPEKIEMFMETPPESYLLRPRFKDRCTLCYECIHLCPEGAIKIIT